MLPGTMVLLLDSEDEGFSPRSLKCGAELAELPVPMRAWEVELYRYLEMT